MQAHLQNEEAQEVHGEPPELVVFDELVQIDAEELEHEAKMAAVHEEVAHAHDVVLVVRIAPCVEKLEHSHLHSCLQERSSQLDGLDATALAGAWVKDAHQPCIAMFPLQGQPQSSLVLKGSHTRKRQRFPALRIMSEAKCVAWHLMVECCLVLDDFDSNLLS